MSQEQPQRPGAGMREQEEAIKYGDVFGVTGDLASKPIAPKDAAMMQTAESRVLGKTQKGGAAAVMQSAASQNERSGVVRHKDVTDVTADQGVTVSETDAPGSRIVTETVGGQVIEQYAEPKPVEQGMAAEPAAYTGSAITIGEALEASAQAAGGKAVDEADAAAIQAAEVRARGSNALTPGGLAASAQSAAAYNVAVDRDEDKIKLGEVLTGAAGKLAADKVATGEDAEGVMSAELRNAPMAGNHPGGVASSVAAAARLNEQNCPRGGA